MANAKKKQKILLVDDTEFIRIYFKDVFWIHGLADKYELMTAENIDVAEKLINSPKTMPDIIFLDLSMPMVVDSRNITTGETGFVLLKKIKENPLTQHIKVIIFTGYDIKEYREKATQLGADGYLVKGENLPEDLIKFVEQLKE